MFFILSDISSFKIKYLSYIFKWLSERFNLVLATGTVADEVLEENLFSTHNYCSMAMHSFLHFFIIIGLCVTL